MRKRFEKPVPEIDRIEEEWWNSHAHLVEAVWAMPLQLREAVRRHYLGRAKRFFLTGSGKRPVKIVEVGCGSGWVGRMLAEPGEIHIAGIDLSEAQIALARQNAAKDGLSGCCEYFCENLADFTVKNIDEKPGVLIHAILHHLSWEEIRTVFGQIALLGPGTRVFIYEPVYLAKMSDVSETLIRIARFMEQLPGKWAQSLQNRYREVNDGDLAIEVRRMCEQSVSQGWVLSPKEIVFPEAEFEDLLHNYFDLKNRYLCSHTSIPAAQAGALSANTGLWASLISGPLPLARIIDRLLWSTGLIRKVTDNYVFMGYECVVKS